MAGILYDLFFAIISIYILLKAIGYAIYEINELNNKFGGIAVITFSIFVVIFTNIIIILY